MRIMDPLFHLLGLAPASENSDTQPKPTSQHRRTEQNDQKNTESTSVRSTPQAQWSLKNLFRPRQKRSQKGQGQHHTDAAHDESGPPPIPYREDARDVGSVGQRDDRPKSPTVQTASTTYSTVSPAARVGGGLSGHIQPGQVSLANSDVISSTTPVKRAPKIEAPAKTPDYAVFESPVFGSSPPAARRPWVLPVEPAVSGIAADQARIGDLEVRAVSIVGPGHRCEEPATPRQDSYRLGRDRAGRHLIIAVADGMSDSRRSDLGATVATRCAVNTLRAHLDGGADPTAEAMTKAFRTSAGAMVAAAKNEGLSEMDIRCALIVAIIPTAINTASEGRRAWFATLADVSAWRRHDTGWCQLAGDQKDDGLDRNTLHNFLPYHPDRAVTVSCNLEPGATVAVVTDGLGDAFTDVPNAAQWFAQRWETPVPLESFVLDVGFHARGQLDDRTSVTVWCRDGVRSW